MIDKFLNTAGAILFTTLTLACLGAVPPVHAWEDLRAASPVSFNDRVIPYKVFAVYVYPGDDLRAGFVDATAGAKITLDGRTIASGEPIQAGSSPGLQVMQIENLASSETTTLNIFVMVPAGNVDKKDTLNRIPDRRVPSRTFTRTGYLPATKGIRGSHPRERRSASLPQF